MRKALLSRGPDRALRRSAVGGLAPLRPRLETVLANRLAARPDWLVRVAPAALWGLIFFSLLAYAAAFRHTYIDDTYITLQYARNLAEHFTWGFFPGRTTNTATSPLNVILLAAVDRLLPGSTVDAVAWATAATWTATLAVLLRISRRLLGGPHFGLLAFVALVTNPLLLSTIGLEGYLFALLMLVAVALFIERRWSLLGVALGLLTLTRPDGGLLVALMLMLLPGGLAARLRLVLAFALAALPWYLFSWLYLGSVVPDTLVIKLEEMAWGPTSFADGFDLYRSRFGAVTLASLWPLAFVPFALLPIWRADRAARLAIASLLAYAVAHYAIYAAMAVPPYHWYYTHQVVPIVFLGALGGTYLLRGLAEAPARADRWAALAATALPATVLCYLAYDQGWPLRQAPIHTNWATPASTARSASGCATTSRRRRCSNSPARSGPSPTTPSATSSTGSRTSTGPTTPSPSSKRRNPGLSPPSWRRTSPGGRTRSRSQRRPTSWCSTRSAGARRRRSRGPRS